MQDYRNLIHPGRQYRLQEKPDKDKTIVAQRLVRIVVNYLAKQKKKAYGHTAQQILDKIKRDHATVFRSDALLSKESQASDQRKLLLELLPQANALERHLSNAFGRCFRYLFENADSELQEAVADRYVVIIREEGAITKSCRSTGQPLK